MCNSKAEVNLVINAPLLSLSHSHQLYELSPIDGKGYWRRSSTTLMKLVPLLQQNMYVQVRNVVEAAVMHYENVEEPRPNTYFTSSG